MATLIGFGPEPAPDAPPPARRRWMRPIALAGALLLLIPAGGAVGQGPAVPRSALAATLQQAPAPTVPEIQRRVQRALYSLSTFPEHESAFAFARSGGATLVATTYQNVLRSADPRLGLTADRSTIAVIGGVRVDPDYPLHQVILIRHGSVTHRAQVIAAELERDVAVLRVRGEHPVLQPECEEGPVPAIGDRTHLFSAGPNRAVTDVRRRDGRITTFVSPEQIQSSQGVPQHGEGGPLVNARGRAIGIAARSVGSVGFRRVNDAFSLSEDINVAFELAGVPNVCPEEEEGEAPPEAPEPPEGELTRAQLAEAALPAVVSIEAFNAEIRSFTNPGGCIGTCRITGSGFGVYSDGEFTWIATNHHVLGSTRFLTRPALTVRKGDEQFLGEVVASSSKMDVALVRVEASLPVLTPACGPQEDLRRGDQIAAIGSPGETFTRASVRRLIQNISRFRAIDLPLDFALWTDWFGYGMPHWSRHGYLEDTVTFGNIRFARARDIKHTAEIYHGNSGGPLLNMRGQVVGINQRFDKDGGRIAINIDRLFGRLADKAGIINPCGPEEGEASGG